MRKLTIVKWAVGLSFAFLIFSVLSWVSSVAEVVREEIGPRVVLDRYEWFVDTWATVQEQDATLDAFKTQLATAIEDYGDKRADWPRDVRGDMALRNAEIRGMLANRNRIAREYRAAIQKINYVPATMLPHFPKTIPSYKLR